jgi:hypothetical protein
VSSILKALKKLETESSQESETPSLPKSIDTKKAVNKRVKGFWLARRMTYTLVTVIILIVAGILLITQRDFFLKTRDREDHQTGPQKQTRKVTPATEQDLGAHDGRISKKERIEPAGTAGPVRTARTESTVSAKRPQPVVPGPSSPGEKAPEREVQKKGAALELEKKPMALSEQKRRISEERLDISGFKLEAIVWTENPASRFAVINGQIVRAGGSVRGVNVKEIGRNHVALESGGRKGNLKFRAE